MREALADAEIITFDAPDPDAVAVEQDEIDHEAAVEADKAMLMDMYPMLTETYLGTARTATMEEMMTQLYRFGWEHSQADVEGLLRRWIGWRGNAINLKRFRALFVAGKES